MSQRFTIVGDGAMGTACAIILAQDPEKKVTLWCQFEENAKLMRDDRENKRYLPGVFFPGALHIESDFSLCASADAFLFAIPMSYLSSTLERIAGEWSPTSSSVPAISVIKGIEQGTFRRPSEIIRSLLPGAEVCTLAGPLHAEELARGMPCSVVAASFDPTTAKRVQDWFSTDRLRVYTSHDLTGAELGGALKNVIAIAAGICDGAKFGDNAKSALMTRGLVEMIRLGLALGAERETFYGMAGLGDLITTCFSPHGRNRRAGERIGAGEKIDAILASSHAAIEGVWTARSVFELSKRLGIEMPVSTEVYQILFENQDVAQAVSDLMQRPPVAE